MRKIKTILKFAYIPMVLCLVWSCSDNSTGPQTPAVANVKVVGTQVDMEAFHQTGNFTVLAVPESESGESILSSAVKAKIKLTSVSLENGNMPTRIRGGAISAANTGNKVDIVASVVKDAINKPSNNPVAVALDIDGSGSMRSNDPQRLRVSGAKDFIDKFSQSNLPNGWNISVFSYRGNPNKPFLDYSELLSPFTDDVQALKTATDGVKTSGTTPTYHSLLEVLDYSEDKKPHNSYERAIVLLSDGYPNSTALRDSVCNVAKRMNTPIYAIGLGPASGLSTNANPNAIAEMRFIAACTNGSYAGISSSGQVVNASSVAKIYKNIAVATSKGNIGYTIHLEGPDFDILSQQQAVLDFTLTLSTPNGSKSVSFGFRSFPSNTN